MSPGLGTNRENLRSCQRTSVFYPSQIQSQLFLRKYISCVFSEVQRVHSPLPRKWCIRNPEQPPKMRLAAAGAVKQQVASRMDSAVAAGDYVDNRPETASSLMISDFRFRSHQESSSREFLRSAATPDTQPQQTQSTRRYLRSRRLRPTANSQQRFCILSADC